MNVLMFMLAGSDTSRDAHKVLLGILPQLPPAIMEEVSRRTSHACAPKPFLSSSFPLLSHKEYFS